MCTLPFTRHPIKEGLDLSLLIPIHNTAPEDKLEHLCQLIHVLHLTFIPHTVSAGHLHWGAHRYLDTERGSKQA